MANLKPGKALNELLKRALMIDTGTEIRDIIIHNIEDKGINTCTLSLEVYKTVETVVEGSQPTHKIVFKNLTLTYKEDEETNEISEQTEVIIPEETTELAGEATFGVSGDSSNGESGEDTTQL